MIVLIFDPNTVLSDFLNLTVGSPTALGATIQWYVTWSTTPPLVQPYGRNFGSYGGVAPVTIPMTPAIAPGAPELDIREISVHNTRGEPVEVAIQFSNGAAPTFRLFNCLLGGGFSLTYNAIPGVDGASWKIFDGEGHVVSQ